MLIFFAIVFLYKNHCISSMYVKCVFFTVTNNNQIHFDLIFMTFTLMMQIK
jgi:hypothetical protein